MQAALRLAPGCLPARLAAPDLARLREVVRPLPPLERHQSLFDGGAARGHLFIVRSGCLRTSVQEAGSRARVMDFLLPGDITGAGTGIETFRGGRVIALERTSVCAVSLAGIKELATRIDGLQDELCRLFEGAHTDTAHHVLAMGRHSARERLALFLHAWSLRRQAAGFPRAELHLPMRREDIASYLGLATADDQPLVLAARARGRRDRGRRPPPGPASATRRPWRRSPASMPTGARPAPATGMTGTGRDAAAAAGARQAPGTGARP
ncbi:MAG: cyclic nucleotide-binding domain-containing protein [Halofilum sp. (in: g-proteobacteria)]|nr:cyclic nucleotide-binding domain-containing protein [Halofilum sp. (in: g-proteobacteria)]